MNEPNYRRLLVWQKAHQNALALIELFDRRSFRFNRVTEQALAAATSIGANIAEGAQTPTARQKKNYWQIALNSSYELDNWLQIFKDSKAFTDKEHFGEIEARNIEVIKILTSLVGKMI